MPNLSLRGETKKEGVFFFMKGGIKAL